MGSRSIRGLGSGDWYEKQNLKHPTRMTRMARLSWHGWLIKYQDGAKLRMRLESANGHPSEYYPGLTYDIR